VAHDLSRLPDEEAEFQLHLMRSLGAGEIGQAYEQLNGIITSATTASAAACVLHGVGLA
jgi:hypothetical protein